MSRARSAADGLEVVRGDVRDPSSLRAALDGVDAVIGAFGVSGFARAIAPTDLYSQGTRILLGSMQAAGARRLLMRSSSAVLHDPAAGFVWNRLLRPMMWAMYADFSLMETLIAESDLDWTVVRPPRLIDGRSAGPVRAVPGDQPAGGGDTLPRIDLPGVLLQELAGPRCVRRRVVLAPG